MYEMFNVIPFTGCGADGRLKLHQAATMMIDSCQFQELQEVEFKKFLNDNHLAIFLYSIQLDILRMPQFNEYVRTAVKIYGAKSIYGLRRITMHDESGKLCLIANATGAFFDLQAQKAVKFDPAIFPLKLDEAEEMECLPRKISIPPESGTEAEKFTVRPSALDPNGHLTSAEYLAAASDVLPENYRFNRVRVEYKKQAKPGEVITPVIHHLPETDKYVIDLKSSDGLSFAVTEFSRFTPGS